MAAFAIFEDTAQSIAEAKAGAWAHMEGKAASPVSGALRRISALATARPRAKRRLQNRTRQPHAPPHRRLFALAAPC
jgi:hypothetical protein